MKEDMIERVNYSIEEMEDNTMMRLNEKDLIDFTK